MKTKRSKKTKKGRRVATATPPKACPNPGKVAKPQLEKRQPKMVYIELVLTVAGAVISVAKVVLKVLNATKA